MMRNIAGASELGGRGVHTFSRISFPVALAGALLYTAALAAPARGGQQGLRREHL
jgi:hypothetical protein